MQERPNQRVIAWYLTTSVDLFVSCVCTKGGSRLKAMIWDTGYINNTYINTQLVHLNIQETGTIDIIIIIIYLLST